MAIAPAPTPHPPARPAPFRPPNPRSTLGFGAPLLCSAYIRLPVAAPGTRASTSIGVCRRTLTTPWGEQQRGSTEPRERSAERALVRSHSGLQSTQRNPRVAQVWDPVRPVFAEESSRGEYAVRIFFLRSHLFPVFIGSCGRWSSVPECLHANLVTPSLAVPQNRVENQAFRALISKTQVQIRTVDRP